MTKKKIYNEGDEGFLEKLQMATDDLSVARVYFITPESSLLRCADKISEETLPLVAVNAAGIAAVQMMKQDNTVCGACEKPFAPRRSAGTICVCVPAVMTQENLVAFGLCTECAKMENRANAAQKALSVFTGNVRVVDGATFHKEGGTC